ncbi:MAG TPA: hypothetical protein QGG37_09900 [Chloroflexota bacterium]|nr:hypothetical protein [Chloroflexota bacterium]
MEDVFTAEGVLLAAVLLLVAGAAVLVAAMLMQTATEDARVVAAVETGDEEACQAMEL